MAVDPHGQNKQLKSTNVTMYVTAKTLCEPACMLKDFELKD